MSNNTSQGSRALASGALLVALLGSTGCGVKKIAINKIGEAQKWLERELKGLISTFTHWVYPS